MKSVSNYVVVIKIKTPDNEFFIPVEVFFFFSHSDAIKKVLKYIQLSLSYIESKSAIVGMIISSYFHSSTFTLKVS